MGAALVLALLVGANPALDEGRVMFQQLDYEHALVKLKSATEAAAPGPERREAYDLYARTWAALGDVKQAEAVYAQLLAKDPLAPPPAEAAPKIRAAYTAAKSSLFPPGTVRLTRVAGPAAKLKVELFDPWGVVTKLELHEQDGSKDRVKPLPVKPSVEATLGARTEQAYVVATNNKGEVLASLGSRAKPLRFARAEKPSAPPTPPPAVTAPDAPKPPPEVQARQLLDEGRDAESLRAVSSARAPGSLARDAVLALFGIEACASARLGDGEHAQLAYRRAFAMEPSLPAPDTCEEGWTAWFAARDSSKREPLELRALSLERTQEATKATVVRKADPLGLTRAVRFHLRRAGGWVDKEAAFDGDRASVEGPTGVLGWWAEVLGDGGTVASLGSASAPLSPEGQPDLAKTDEVKTVSGPPLEETPPPPPKRSGRLRGTVILGVIGAASLGVGSLLGVFAQQHDDTLNGLPNTTVTSMSQRDSFGLYHQQHAEAVFATLFWCLAGALIVSAASLFLFGSGGPL